MPWMTLPSGIAKPNPVAFKYCELTTNSCTVRLKNAYMSSLIAAFCGSNHGCVPNDASLTTLLGLFGPSDCAAASDVAPTTLAVIASVAVANHALRRDRVDAGPRTGAGLQRVRRQSMCPPAVASVLGAGPVLCQHCRLSRWNTLRLVPRRPAARRSFSDRARACTETRPPCREGSMARGFLERTGSEMEYQRFNAAKEFPCEKRSSACPVGLVSIRFPLIPSPGGLGTGPRAGRDC